MTDKIQEPLLVEDLYEKLANHIAELVFKRQNQAIG